jgi:cation diffusion facilitator family transporter
MTQIVPMHNVKRTSVRLAAQRAEFRAGIISLTVGIILMAVKFYAYLLTHSNAVYSDALETIVNVVAACFALYSIILANRPADQEHPYGHGKVEFFSSGLEGGMVLLAAVIIVGKVAVSFFHGAPPMGENLDTGVGLMGGAMVLNGGLGTYLFFTGKRHNSITLQASGAHLMTDAVDSVVVLAALIIVRFTGWRWVDPAAAILVAIYIAWLGVRLIKRSAAGLMDQQDAGDQKLLRQILDSHIGPTGKDPQICSYHKLRHRHSGRYHWVDFHLMVPGWWNIDRGHRLASAIEYEIELALGEGNATAHVEPCAQADCALCQAEKSKS